MSRYYDEFHYETAHFDWWFTQVGSDEEDITAVYAEKRGDSGDHGPVMELAYNFLSFSQAQSFADNFELDHYPEED